MNNITRKEALEQGLRFYYTGPCKHGHDSVKYASNYNCLECAVKRGQSDAAKGYQAQFRGSDYGKYLRHHGHAKERGIDFLLTFEEWIDIWISSGYYHLRGNTPGCFVMGRYGDEGAYEVGNVSIIPFYENFQVPNNNGGTHGYKNRGMYVRSCDDNGCPLI